MKQYIWLDIEVRNSSYRLEILQVYKINNELVVISELTGDRNGELKGFVHYCSDMLAVEVPDTTTPLEQKLYIIGGKEACYSHRYNTPNSIEELAEMLKNHTPLKTEMHPVRKSVFESYEREGEPIPGIGFYTRTAAERGEIRSLTTPKPR